MHSNRRILVTPLCTSGICLIRSRIPTFDGLSLSVALVVAGEISILARSVLLEVSMALTSIACIAILTTLLVVPAAAQDTVRVPVPEQTFGERFRADRDKFDREMKLDNKRPWDNKRPGRTDEQPPAPRPPSSAPEPKQ